MTNEEFQTQMQLMLQQVLVDNKRTRQHSTEMHTVTQARVDGLADTLRNGLRDDVEILLKPVIDKQESHGKKLDDHEGRIRTLETSDNKRQVIIGGGAGLMAAACIEGIRAIWRAKGGP